MIKILYNLKPTKKNKPTKQKPKPKLKSLSFDIITLIIYYLEPTQLYILKPYRNIKFTFNAFPFQLSITTFDYIFSQLPKIIVTGANLNVIHNYFDPAHTIYSLYNMTNPKYPSTSTLNTKSLHLTGNIDISTILIRCPKLQRLHISDHVLISNLIFITNTPHIHTLILTSVHKLSDLSILPTCPNLHTIIIYSNTNIKDTSPLFKCTKLKFLTISSFAHHLDLLPNKSLKSLRIPFCANLGSLLPLLDCPKLKFLDISYCGTPQNISIFQHKQIQINAIGTSLIWD